MRLILLGLPGTGVATLADTLSQTTGSMRIQSIGSDDPLGWLAQELDTRDTSNGYILTGLPISVPQAQSLDRLLISLGIPLQLAILISLAAGEQQQRIEGRRHCLDCGEPFNIRLVDDRFENECPFCGGHRIEHNNGKAINDNDRLVAAERHMDRLARYYRTQNKLLHVDIEGDIKTDLARVSSALETRMRHHQI